MEFKIILLGGQMNTVCIWSPLFAPWSGTNRLDMVALCCSTVYGSCLLSWNVLSPSAICGLCLFVVLLGSETVSVTVCELNLASEGSGLRITCVRYSAHPWLERNDSSQLLLSPSRPVMTPSLPHGFWVVDSTALGLTVVRRGSDMKVPQEF